MAVRPLNPSHSGAAVDRVHQPGAAANEKLSALEGVSDASIAGREPEPRTTPHIRLACVGFVIGLMVLITLAWTAFLARSAYVLLV